jgi:hypothetical protein
MTSSRLRGGGRRMMVLAADLDCVATRFSGGRTLPAAFTVPVRQSPDLNPNSPPAWAHEEPLWGTGHSARMKNRALPRQGPERKREKRSAPALVFARPARIAGGRGLALWHRLALGPALLP